MTTWPVTLALATLVLGTGACTSKTSSGPTGESSARPIAAASTPSEARPPAVVEASEIAASAEGEPKAEPDPATVFAAFIDPERRHWAIDVTAGIADTALEDRLDAMGDMGELELKAGDPLLPTGFAVGDPWTVVTRTRVEHRAAIGFDAVMDSSGSPHLVVHLSSPREREKAKGPALALRGHVLAGAKLRMPEPLPPAAFGPDTFERVIAALDPHIGPEQRAMKKRIEVRHVRLYAGRFPGGRTHVVLLNAQKRGGKQEPPLVLSTMSFLKVDGSVEHFEITEDWGGIELLGLIDVDGDGLDEVYYEPAYGEAVMIELLQWEGEKPSSRTITWHGVF